MTLEPEPKKDKKKDKVRSAWISFVGRILAQLVGAAATVSLGFMVLHRYTPPPGTDPPAITVVVIAPSSEQPTIGTESPAAPPDAGAARQVEMARAIASAVSSTLRPRQ